MAKSKRGGRGISTTHKPTANASVARRTALPIVSLPPISQTPQFDRRVFSPDRTVRPPGGARRLHAHIVVDTFGESVRRQTKAPLRFAVPQKVALCVRRKQRKEVLHAINKTGKGVYRRKPRRNFWSAIKC